MANKIKISLVKSVIDRPERQKATVRALGITKMNRPIEVISNPQVLGMIAKVKHLLKVENL